MYSLGYIHSTSLNTNLHSYSIHYWLSKFVFSDAPKQFVKPYLFKYAIRISRANLFPLPPLFLKNLYMQLNMLPVQETIWAQSRCSIQWSHNFRTPFSTDPFLIHERLFNYWGSLYVKVTIPSKVRVRRNYSGYLVYWHKVVLSFSEYEYPILHLLHLNANILGHEPNICHFLTHESLLTQNFQTNLDCCLSKLNHPYTNKQTKYLHFHVLYNKLHVHLDILIIISLESFYQSRCSKPFGLQNFIFV